MVLIVLRNEQGLVVRVKNRGRAIAPELLQVIFEPLVRFPVEGSGSHRFANLGLGLFIAREIVLAHGGTIRAACDAEETQFTVEIPQAAHKMRRPDEQVREAVFDAR